MNKELKITNKKSGTAVLFIHGILGTPRHFDFLLPLLPDDWSVCALTLPGHGGSVSDFSRSSMTQWKAAVESSLLQLTASHERVFIVGHSMGTLLAVHAASTQQKKLAGIFALAMPLRPHFTPKALGICLHTAFRSPETDNAFQRVCRRSCSISLSRNPFAYIGWIPRYLELFALARDTRKAMPTLAVPCIALQSARDELVSRTSLRYMGRAKVMELAESMHYFYSDTDRQAIENEFKKFISE